MNDQLTPENTNSVLQSIRKDFFVYRNGIVADALRKSGLPHKLIFGLQLPQLSEIARKYGKDKALAESLWNDFESRESRLLATYIFPPTETDIEEAIAMVNNLRSNEEAEILAFRLLRFLPYSAALLNREINSETSSGKLARYCLQMLRRNLERTALN